MLFYNKRGNNIKVTVTAASILTLAIIIMVASNMAVTPAALATITTPPASQSGIELSSQPVYQTQEKLVSQSPINQTHAEFVVSANGTLTLPNATETITTTSTKSGIVSMMDGTFAGKEILTSEDGSENATATIYEIIRFNMETGNGTGVAIALFHTNSTELLAPLNDMILTGRGELYTDETGLHSLWKWQSGIP
ncbi:MAG: hypothetical protein M3M91_02065 [Thermoproteota archaeon]|nr:hypothetical protein [Thermoproteota archaeon]